MKIVVQHVKKAQIEVDSKIVGSIFLGFLLLIGIENTDTTLDADILIDKIINARSFRNPENSKYFDLSLLEAKAETLIVSQFTLAADFNKGRKPEFKTAMEPTKAKVLYDYFVSEYSKKVENLKVQTGIFGAKMLVDLCNDGPITYVLNSNDFKKN